jgi:hypothetical protein
MLPWNPTYEAPVASPSQFYHRQCRLSLIMGSAFSCHLWSAEDMRSYTAVSLWGANKVAGMRWLRCPFRDQAFHFPLICGPRLRAPACPQSPCSKRAVAYRRLQGESFSSVANVRKSLCTSCNCPKRLLLIPTVPLPSPFTTLIPFRLRLLRLARSSTMWCA